MHPIAVGREWAGTGFEEVLERESGGGGWGNKAYVFFGSAS